MVPLLYSGTGTLYTIHSNADAHVAMSLILQLSQPVSCIPIVLLFWWAPRTCHYIYNRSGRGQRGVRVASNISRALRMSFLLAPPFMETYRFATSSVQFADNFTIILCDSPQ